MFRHPLTVTRLLNVRRWSERTVISLVMQTVDNSLTLTGRTRFGRWRLVTQQDASKPAPTYIPVAHEVISRAARRLDGVASSSVFENLDKSLTAHFVGGCVIGPNESMGVVDGYQRAFGHPGLHIMDGSTITANLGVNPSLTITAQTERAMAMWPNKGEVDPRPTLGSAYVPVAAVSPSRPIVPVAATGALRLPIVT